MVTGWVTRFGAERLRLHGFVTGVHGDRDEVGQGGVGGRATVVVVGEHLRAVAGDEGVGDVEVAGVPAGAQVPGEFGVVLGGGPQRRLDVVDLGPVAERGRQVSQGR